MNEFVELSLPKSFPGFGTTPIDIKAYNCALNVKCSLTCFSCAVPAGISIPMKCTLRHFIPFYNYYTEGSLTTFYITVLFIDIEVITQTGCYIVRIKDDTKNSMEGQKRFE